MKFLSAKFGFTPSPREGPKMRKNYAKPAQNPQNGRSSLGEGRGTALLWTNDLWTSAGGQIRTHAFFSLTFRVPAGYPSKIPGYPAKKFGFPGFRGTYRTFWPPPLHVEDPHLTRRYPDQKVWVWVPFSFLNLGFSDLWGWWVNCGVRLQSETNLGLRNPLPPSSSYNEHPQLSARKGTRPAGTTWGQRGLRSSCESGPRSSWWFTFRVFESENHWPSFPRLLRNKFWKHSFM